MRSKSFSLKQSFVGIALELGPSGGGNPAIGQDWHVFTTRATAMGIRARPISPGSPWQNGIAERLIGTLRREFLNHMVIFGEAHVRRILSAYAVYYNQTRTHLALNKDCPLGRPIQRFGRVAATPVLAGL